MRKLGDYASGFLEAGDHMVRITGQKAVRSTQKGTAGREYTFEDDSGSSIRETFWLTDAALSRLYSFVCAVAGDKEKAKGFDADNELHHANMIGRRLYIRVRKKTENDYHEVYSWYSVNGKTVTKEAAWKQEEKPAPKSAPVESPDEERPSHYEDKDDWGGL